MQILPFYSYLFFKFITYRLQSISNEVWLVLDAFHHPSYVPVSNSNRFLAPFPMTWHGNVWEAFPIDFFLFTCCWMLANFLVIHRLLWRLFFFCPTTSSVFITLNAFPFPSNHFQFNSHQEIWHDSDCLPFITSYHPSTISTRGLQPSFNTTLLRISIIYSTVPPQQKDWYPK